MNKQLVMMILLLVSAVVWAGEPEGYYNDAQGKTGITLKAALHDIIDNHKVVSYSGLHSAYYDTDNLDGKVWDIYSHNPNGAQPYEYPLGSNKCGNYSGEGDCYNREHTFPQSWFSKAAPMVSDLFQVLPTDGYVNGRRSSYPYGEVDNASWTSMNGSKVGSNTTSGYSGTVFEPIDEYKGDLARIYFYMATRYYGEDSSWPGSAMVDGAEPKAWAIDLLMKWHVQDPVSTKEIDRNDAAYGHQNNRNPYVDYPEYACLVWGGGDCDSTIVIVPGDTIPVDPTIDVTINMGASDYQLIVDYVNADANLPNTDEHPDNTENYYGASAFYSNFDGRVDAYNSKFASSDEAISEVLGDIFLPAKVDSSLLNVDYIISYSTYDGSNANGSKTFHCSSTDPLAFTEGAATVDPIDPNPDDSTIVIPPDTTVVTPPDTTVTEPVEALTSLNLTFDRGLEDCKVYQLSGATNWELSTYNDDGYLYINTYEQGANESWVVTSAVNLDTLENKTFSFEITSYNSGRSIGDCGQGQFEVYYSNYYDGARVDKGQWTRITVVDDVMLGDERWEWANATVDISSIAGNAVSFAFAHTSDAANGTTWEVDNVILTGDIVSSISDVMSPNISIYPNPSKGAIQLSSKVDELKIINISGQIILSQAQLAKGEFVDISVLPQGIYFANVKNGNNSQMIKFVKE